MTHHQEHTQPQPTAAQKLRGYAPTIAGAVALGLLIQFQVVGIFFLLGYGIYSVVRRVPSRTTGILALASLAITVGALIAGRKLIAENFAIYGFLLFVITIINLTLEQWRLSKALQKNRRH